MIEKILEIYDGEIDVRREITAVATTTAVVVMFAITTATTAASGSTGAIGVP